MKLVFRNAALFFLLLLSIQTVFAQSQVQLNIRMLQAAKNDQADSVKYWLDKGADVNYTDSIGQSSLNFAANNNNIKLSEFLIQKGANVNGMENSFPPVCSAAYSGNLRICHLLFLNGANLNNLNNYSGKTYSDYVKEFGYLRIAEYLENPQKYSQTPTCLEYYQYSKNALNVNDTLNALKYADLAFQTGEVELSQTSNQFGNFINDIAIIYYYLGQFNKAESLLLNALKLNEFYDGKESASYAGLLNVVALNYQNQKKYNEGEPYFNAAISIYQKLFGENSPTYLSTLTSFAYFFLIQEKFDKAEALFQQIQKILLNKNETQNSEYVSTLNILGEIKLIKGNFVESEQLYKQVLKIQKELTGIYDTDYARYSNNLAQVYLKQDKYNEAESLLLLTSEIQKTMISENHPDYAETLSSLARIYVKKYQFKKAELLYQHALSIQREHSIENSISSAITMNSLATLYEETYQWEKAEELYLKSLQIAKELEVKDTQNYSSMLNNLAGFYSNVGQYNKVEPLYQDALEFLKKIYGEFHPSYLNCLHNLSVFYTKIKLYDKAFATCGLALGFTNIAQGKENVDYLRYNNSMASLSMNLYCFDLADSILNSSIQICEKLGLDTHDPLFLNTIELLATLYSHQKKYDKAESLLMQLLDPMRNDLGEKSLELASLFQKLGIFYSNQCKFELAEPFYKKALEVKKEIEGENHPDYIELLNSFGMACHENGDYDQAEKYYLDASTKLTNQVKFSFSYLSSREREKLWEENISIFNVYNIFIKDSYSRNLGISKFAYNNELFIKGLLLNTSLDIKSKILNSNDSTLIDGWKTLRIINDLIFGSDRKQEELLKLLPTADSIDKILTKKSQIYSQTQAELKIQWQDVQAKLKEGEAAIEFSSFSYFHKEWTDSTLYCALVLKKGMEYPVMVPLCEQKQLDSLWVGGKIAPNLLYASRGVTAEYKDQLPNGKRLYQLIWQPLEKELQNVKTVYYSPSGSLHQVSFAALPIDTTNYLCDKYNLVQLSSTRQLATAAWQAKPAAISSTVLFGGIKYDFTPDSTRSSITFGFLKGTKDEVETISATLQTKSIKSTLYTGINGNEEAFKALNNQNINVLHIATHGFFNPIEKEKPQDLDRMMLMGEQRFRYSPNPLLRSGLILAGGNRTWKGGEPPAGMEDGILTAQEISEMDLHQTELVVLSACETGLGDVNGGEGVFGLQRAFKLAGVKTIIMSLWKVNDEATSEMMQLFYSKWLGGMDKREAFRLAQQELKEKYSDPYYWAGFVMVD